MLTSGGQNKHQIFNQNQGIVEDAHEHLTEFLLSPNNNKQDRVISY